MLERGRRIIKGIHFYSFGSLRKLYTWVLSWADKKHGTAALAILSFAESSFFPIPPDTLQIALSISKPQRAFWYAFINSIFSVLGGIFGYLIGLFLFDSIGNYIISTLGYQQQFEMVGKLFVDNAFWAILAAAFTPIPYKVFTLAAGFWQIGLLPLILASVIGRSARFFLEALLLYFYGARMRIFIEKYFNWITLGVFLLVLAGFLALKYFGNFL